MSTRGPIRVTRRDLEALTGFARAYLHEDFVAEYGSAAEAAAAFARDAGVEERRRLAGALDALAGAAEGRPAEALHRFLERSVRCAWRPSGTEDLRVLRRALAVEMTGPD